ncbi:hypothetical protein, partial [Sphingomonas parva]|uniref:hypothetical protein n=1 Tax=Sphingomonas parva TaxID=2555898 RepID=UPI001CDC75FC
APDGAAHILPENSTLRLGVRRVPAVGLLCDALEGISVVLHAHELAGALVALLPITVRSLKLSASGYRAAAEAISSIRRHF